MDLVGRRSGKTWHVDEQLKLEPGLSPGQFSVGYKATGLDGQEAFLKASDLSMAFAKQDPVKALLKMTTAHEFERSILEHCGGNRLDKVVTALDSGALEVTLEGSKEFVFFIVFELAQGDLRKFVEVEQGNDLLWIVSAIHSFAVAINQIHGVDVFHNDFKPANALVFDVGEKIADFGRATSPAHPVMHDPMLCAGDKRFAPPEQLYTNENPVVDIDKFLKARAGDLYNLGSIIHFLITKRMITPEILGRLNSVFRPRGLAGGWLDSYEAVLPYWRQVYDAILTEFYDDLQDTWVKDYKFVLIEIREIVLQLCEPDFRKRGDVALGRVGTAQYSLTRIISKIDNVRTRLLVQSRVN